MFLHPHPRTLALYRTSCHRILVRRRVYLPLTAPALPQNPRTVCPGVNGSVGAQGEPVCADIGRVGAALFWVAWYNGAGVYMCVCVCLCVCACSVSRVHLPLTAPALPHNPRAVCPGVDGGVWAQGEPVRADIGRAWAALLGSAI